MKKVIFEGTVNGTKFNDVNAYNEAVTKALAEGKEVQASSHTKSVDVEDEDKKCEVCESKHCSCKKDAVKLIFPGFEWNEKTQDFDENLFKEFADYIINGSEKDDEHITNSLQAALERVYDSLTMNSKNEKSITDYANGLDCIIPKLEEIDEKNQNKMDEIMHKIEKLQAEFNECDRRDNIINEYLDFYDAANKLVNGEDPENEGHVDINETKPQKEILGEGFVNDFIKMLFS